MEFSVSTEEMTSLRTWDWKDGLLLTGPSASPEIQFRLPALMAGSSKQPATPFPELSLQASLTSYLLTDTHMHTYMYIHVFK